jgi:altronate hydrolase
MLQEYILHLHPQDPVGIAKQDLQPGTSVSLPEGGALTVRELIPAGHKLALVDIPAGGEVLRYGYPIGRAADFIPAGSWVHSHNLVLGEIPGPGEYTFQLVAPAQPAPSGRTFAGYARPGGRAGTRNYIALISTVSCSAHVVSQIARAFPPERLAEYPQVDGIIPIVHHSGCSLPQGGLSHTYLRRMLANLARHPNVGAAVYVGLGCEVNQIDECQPLYSPEEMDRLAPYDLVIQDQGGFSKTVAAGIALVEKLLPQVNAIQRTPQPLAELAVALQCGGSDGWSGVTANPLVGRVTDTLVLEGGTAVLAETPEVFGAEYLLTQRVSSPQVAEDFTDRFQWWTEESKRRGFSVDNNPSPGNKRGGLTNIFEKSLGAVAKAGSTPLNGVYEYGERVEQRGLVFMDTPGNDPISVTGQLAGGCNLILFTTGRGSVYGSAVAPCLKIATHSSLYERMPDDMDFNAGQLLEGSSWEDASQALLDLLVAVASGQRTRSETHGLSENEFVPWQPDLFL